MSQHISVDFITTKLMGILPEKFTLKDEFKNTVLNDFCNTSQIESK